MKAQKGARQQPDSQGSKRNDRSRLSEDPQSTETAQGGTTSGCVFATPAGEPRERIIEKRPLDKLTSHPVQADAFFPHDDARIEELAQSLHDNGLENPVEILPDGTIICGHGRVLAAKRLGWSEIECWVRHDLQEKGEAAVVARLVDDNVNRRQLSPLALAKAYRAYKQICHNGQQRKDAEIRGDIRDHFAKRLRTSGRTLDRWERLLDAPLEIQQAVERREIDLKTATNVLTLAQEVQAEIAARIRDGKDPAAVIRRLQSHASPARKAPAEKLQSLLVRLNKAAIAVDKYLPVTPYVVLADARPEFHHTVELLRSLGENIDTLTGQGEECKLLENPVRDGLPMPEENEPCGVATPPSSPDEETAAPPADSPHLKPAKRPATSRPGPANVRRATLPTSAPAQSVS